MKFAFVVILAIRTTFWAMVTMDQNRNIHQHRQHQVLEERCILNSVLVCSECLRVVNGVSRSRLLDPLPFNICPLYVFVSVIVRSDQAMVIGLVNYEHFLLQRTSEPQTWQKIFCFFFVSCYCYGLTSVVVVLTSSPKLPISFQFLPNGVLIICMVNYKFHDPS